MKYTFLTCYIYMFHESVSILYNLIIHNAGKYLPLIVTFFPC